MEKQFTNMRDIARSFANAMNLLRPETENLHQMVAYLSYNIADEMDYSDEDKKDILYASLLYDVGIGMMPERQERYYFKDMAAPGIGIIGDEWYHVWFPATGEFGFVKQNDLWEGNG